jgi:very-short-patch-repair endonuclease
VPFPKSIDRLRRNRLQSKAMARQLRTEQTEAEAALWQLLRNRELIGAKFRRQVPIGRYVADFYCHERWLVVELDGPIHSEPHQMLHDQSRDAFLRSLGLKVLRLSNEEIFNSPEDVQRKIREAACRPPT